MDVKTSWASRPITKRLDGTFVITVNNGWPYHVIAGDPAYPLADVAAAWDALPEGDSKLTEAPIPEPTAAEIRETRIADIDARLSAIDAEKLRPSSEIALALATGGDAPYALKKLQALEDEAAALRAERAELAKREAAS